MANDETVTRKLSVYDRSLAELRSLGTVTAEQVAADWRTRRAIERDLWILVQIMFELCHRFIGRQGRVHAPSGGDLIRRCVQLGILTENERYYQIVRLQTMLIDYDRDPGPVVLATMVNEHLDDFARFSTEVRAYEEGGQ